MLVVQVSTRPTLTTVEKITKELSRSDLDDNTSYKTSEARQWFGVSSSTRTLPTTRIKKEQVYNNVDNESNLKDKVQNTNIKREVLEFSSKPPKDDMVTIPEEHQNKISLHLTKQSNPLLSTTIITTPSVNRAAVSGRSKVVRTTEPSKGEMITTTTEQQNDISLYLTRETTSIKTVAKMTKDVTRKIMENNAQICCQKLSLTSTGETKELYPFVIGVYHLTNDSRVIYAKEGQKRFISRPPGLTRRGMNTFSWGLNNNPDGKWGWIKAFSNAECPDMIDHWKAYDKIRKTWVADNTLTFQCL